MPTTSGRRWLPFRVIAMIWRVIRTIVFLIGLAVILLGVGGYFAFRHAAPLGPKPLPAHYALTLDLTQAPPDAPKRPQWLAALRGGPPTLAETIEALDRAAHDSDLTAIDIELGGDCCSLTTAEELHDALVRFRDATHKTVTARAMSFDGASGLGAYIVATGASRIALSAAGDFAVTGVAMQQPFAAGLLGKLGIDAQYEHIGKYKTYPQMYTRSAPSKANVAMLNSLVGSLYASALAPIAQRLGTSPDDAGKLLDQAPVTADAAKQDKLVDTVLPLTARFGHFQGPHASLARYIADAPAPRADAKKVALIVATGEVAAPEASGETNKIEPKRLAAELRAAAQDSSVKAIVLRMDTPGGAVTGSALVGAEVAAAASRKPLIVTMGGLDASGGYWISSHATRLLADPATLTGSIGVLGGKLSFGTLLSMVGVNVTGATKGANALFDSPTTPWSKDQLSRLQTLLNANYQQFVNWVAAGRHMSPAQVNTVGRGRVWTGAQARSRGLVDEIGGYNAAFAAVRTALGLGEHAPLDIVDGNEGPGPGALLSLVARQANPLGLAALPAPLRDLLGAASSGARGRTQAIRAEMPALTLR